MPSSTEKQKRFFGAVMGAKKGKGGVGGKARSVAKNMSEETIKHYLKKAYAKGFADKCAEKGVDPVMLGVTDSSDDSGKPTVNTAKKLLPLADDVAVALAKALGRVGKVEV